MGCLHGLSEPDAINMFASGWDHLRAVQIGDTSQVGHHVRIELSHSVV